MPKPFNVFVSYSHNDTALRKELDEHLKTLRDANIINIWTDSNIMPGTEWEKEIRNNLKNAQIILLLVSASFLASPFCQSVELKEALERHEANTARVIPIILRPAFLEMAPFSKLQALPHNADGRLLPVTSWSDRNDAWTTIVRGIFVTANELEEKERAANP